MSYNTKDVADSDTADSTADAETHSTTVRHDCVRYEEFCVTIVEAVAAATGRSTADLPPLQQTIDTDALDMLLNKGQSSVSVSFDYADATVWVAAKGTIQIEVDGSPKGGDD